MSTDFQILPDPAQGLVDIPVLGICESGSTFTIDVQHDDADKCFMVLDIRLTANELIDMALRLIQPALYQVDDVNAAKARIVATVEDMHG